LGHAHGRDPGIRHGISTELSLSDRHKPPASVYLHRSGYLDTHRQRDQRRRQLLYRIEQHDPPGKETNNAVQVSDLGKFVGGLLEQEWIGYDVITIGARGQMTVGEVARFLADAFGGRSRIRINPAPKRSFIISSACACDR
jgi:hypothetical protein